MSSMTLMSVGSGSPPSSAATAYLVLSGASGPAKPVRGPSPKRRKPSGGRPPAVARRNERERNRVRQVNLGFATLRQHVPNGAKSKKMSKVETLRSAVQYIKQLQRLLDETGRDAENSLPAFEEMARRGRSAGSSPAPSVPSEASSPYGSLSPEDEDLLDLGAWLS